VANRHHIRIAGITIGMVALCASTKGQLIIPFNNLVMQFAPNPPSPGLPEFLWTGPGGNLVTGPGAVGNGDGDLGIAAQTPGGLEVDTPFVIPGIPNSTIDVSGTHFYDVTLSLSSGYSPGDLQDKGAVILVALNEVDQPMTNGSFQMWTTPAADIPGQLPVLLLNGTMTNNSIAFVLGGTSADYQSQQVTLTGGAIDSAANAAWGGVYACSWEIGLTTTSPIGVADLGPIIPGGVDYAAVDAFSATSEVPEPTPMSVLTAAAIGLSVHSRRRLCTRLR
jgi:hypothetical protein